MRVRRIRRQTTTARIDFPRRLTRGIITPSARCTVRVEFFNCAKSSKTAAFNDDQRNKKETRTRIGSRVLESRRSRETGSRDVYDGGRREPT